MFNFSYGVLPYKKFQYQEGKENDCKLLCADGIVTGGSVVLSAKSRFLEQAIIKARENQTSENKDKSVELDFKIYSKNTLKVSSFELN